MLSYVNLVSDDINQFGAAIMVYEKVNHEGQTIGKRQREKEKLSIRGEWKSGRVESGRRKRDRDREIETERKRERE